MRHSHLAFTIILSFMLNSPIAATTLTGSIEHADKLAPIPERLKPGKAFTGQIIPSSEADEWFVIPKWLSGTWRSIQVIRTESYDSRTGSTDQNERILPEARKQETLGYQQDRKHDIWTLRRLPAPEKETKTNSESESKPTVTTETYRDNNLVSASEDKVVFRTLDTIVSVDNKEKKIRSVEQRESIRTIVPMRDGMIALYSDIQTYDEQGFQKTREQYAEFRKRIDEYHRLDEFAGKSLHASFLKFLERSGQVSLEPDKE